MFFCSSCCVLLTDNAEVFCCFPIVEEHAGASNEGTAGETEYLCFWRVM